MTAKFILVPPKGIAVKLCEVKREFVETQPLPSLQQGAKQCQEQGVILNTNDPVGSAVAEGDCLSRIHHPDTPNWVSRSSKIIFAPIIALSWLTPLFINFILPFTELTPTDWAVGMPILIGHFLVSIVSWRIFVSGPKKPQPPEVSRSKQ